MCENKNHVAYVAARLAREVHEGQADKAGKDYFDGHLSAVGSAGRDWKEKAAGFLHDAAEDTGYTVWELMERLKRGAEEWAEDPDAQGWAQEFDGMIGPVPGNGMQMPAGEEWNEIAEALELLDSGTAASREEYIRRFREHAQATGRDLAIRVKLNDLRHNMDIYRIPHPAEKDFARLERYRKEYGELERVLPDCRQKRR